MPYTVITKISEIGELISALSQTDTIYLDIEATGLNPFTDKVLLIQARVGEKVFIVDCLKCTAIDYILSLLYTKRVVGHNLKFDLRFLYVKYGLMATNVFDTMLAEVLIYEGIGEKFYSLAHLVEKYLNQTMDKDVRESFYTQEILDFTEEQLEYSARDVDVLPDIEFVQEANLKNVKQYKTFLLEMQLLPVVITMEINGIKLDREKWLELAQKAVDKSQETRELLLESAVNRINFSEFPNLLVLFESFGIPVTTKKAKTLYSSIAYNSFTEDDFKANFKNMFNVASNQQMLKLLNYLGIKLESTGEKTLKELHSDDEVIKYLLEYREYYKLGTSFGEKFLTNVEPMTGRIHSNFNQLGTDSGRFTSSSPNLQQIVKDSSYRDCFIADEGNVIITADYSQQELRLAGALTGEPKFKEAFNNEIDMHTMTGSLVYGIPLEEVTPQQRNKAKTLNFAILYGSSDKGLHYNFGFTLEESKVLLQKFYESYPVLEMFKSNAEDMIQQLKYSVSMYGRKRFFETKVLYDTAKDMYSDEASIKRKGFNHMIQGSGADVTKLALCNIYYENPFGSKLKILMTVHDEIVCEVSKDIEEQAMEFIERCMLSAEQPFLKDIPAKISIKSDKCWSK